jgi:hypothetical protein
MQKISEGDIAIPLVRMETNQKCAKGVHLLDLAKYLDARVDAAKKELAALTPVSLVQCPCWVIIDTLCAQSEHTLSPGASSSL